MHRRREPRPQQPKKLETRRFSTDRRSSLYGYLDTPNVDDELEFTRLPHFAYYTGRLVQIGRRIWELWSPNSSRSPFYPGKCCDNFLLDPPLALHFRRVDGHLGRFDPTVSPQEIDQDAWLPFIHRRIPMGAKIQDYPEFVVVPNVWLADDAPARHSGTLNPHFLQTYEQRNAQLDAQMERLQGIYLKRPRWWTRRPLYPYGANFKSLMKSVTYDFAVDTLNTIHRGVKLKAAWIELVERFLVDSDWSEEIQLRRGLEPANDDFMGAWVNKAPQALVTWLTRQKIPCFIIHLCTPQELAPFPDVPKRPDFFSGSEAEQLRADHNRYKEVASRMGGIYVDPTPDSWIFPEERNPARNLEKASRSFSRNLGWSESPGVTVEAGQDTASVLLPSPDPEATSPPSLRPPPPTETWAKLRPPALETLVIDPERVPWIVPPVVKRAPPGEWSKWVETDETEVRTVRKVGRKYEMTGYVYYDREKQHAIKLRESPALPPGYVADRRVFGFPAPDLVFERPVGQDWAYSQCSRWLYCDRHPSKDDVQKQAMRPKASQLPRIADLKKGGVDIGSGPNSDDDDDDDDDDETLPVYKPPLIPSADHGSLQAPVSDRAGGPPDSSPERPVSLGEPSPPPTPAPRADVVMGELPIPLLPIPLLHPASPAHQETMRPTSHAPQTDIVMEELSIPPPHPATPPHQEANQVMHPPSPPPQTDIVRAEQPISLPHAPSLAQHEPNEVVRPQRPALPSRNAAEGARSMEGQPNLVGGEAQEAQRHEEMVIEPEPLPLSASLVRELPPRTAHVRRLAVGPFGVMDVASGDLISRYLVVTNSRVEGISMEDLLAHLRTAAPLYEHAQYHRVFHTVDDGEQVFWLAMASEHDALLARGYLASRGTADNVILHCSFVDEASFQSAAERATHEWSCPAPQQAHVVSSPRPTLFSRLRGTINVTRTPFGTPPPLSQRLRSPSPTGPATYDRSHPVAGPSRVDPLPSLAHRLSLDARIYQNRTPSPSNRPLVRRLPSCSPPPRRMGHPPASQPPAEDDEDGPPFYRGRRAGRQHRKRGAKKGSGVRPRKTDGP